MAIISRVLDDFTSLHNESSVRVLLWYIVSPGEGLVGEGSTGPHRWGGQPRL